MMRVMLVANVDPPNRFANGATGRLLSWEPAAGRERKPIPANDERICARFCHESAAQQRVRLPGTDWVDVTARMESAPHEATMVQLPLGPAYALVLHKVQSLTMPGKVLGCLEGIFAHGQVYVLISRVTDPRNFCLVGLPPADLLDEVAEAWAANGFDVDACFAAAAAVTEDWEYAPAGSPRAATRNVRSRLTRRVTEERRVPVRLRTLAEILDPQPQTAEVLHRLLDWIDRADRAAQAGEPKPAFTTAAGDPVFPDDGEEWWLTDFDRRKKKKAPEEPSSSDPETEPDGNGEEDDDEDDEDESDEEYRTGAAADSEDDGARGATDGEAAGKPDREGAAAAGAGEARPPRSRREQGNAPGAPDGAGGRGSGVGLRNLGNTCYMNAVVQATLACGGAGRAVAEESRPQATEIRRRTQELLQTMRTVGGGAAAAPGARPVISPREFWRAVRSACPEFDNTRQHDAKDFFLALRRELARLPGTEEPSPAWAAWLAEPELHVTTYMTCAGCSATRHNLPGADQPPQEPERLVTAELQPDAEYASVMEAIGSYFGPEPVDDWNGCKCGGLGGVRVAKCRTLPRVLAVWLKRFRSAAGVGRRIGAPVRHLADELDLTGHLDARAEAAGRARATTPNSTRYRARAVVCHHGETLRGGHYTCWVRAAAAPAGSAEGAWGHYDDSDVGRPQAALPPTVESDAYLVFYERIPPAAADTPGPAQQPVEIGAAASPEAPDTYRREDTDHADEVCSDVEMEDGEEIDDPMDTTT